MTATIVNAPTDKITCKNLVGGAWKLPEQAELRELASPYSGKTFAAVPLSGNAEVSETVTAAHNAFAAWHRTPIKERCNLLFKFRELLLKNLSSLSHITAYESGKTVSEAEAGILKGIEVLEFALSLQNMPLGGRLEVSRGIFCESQREPLGVVAGITPFNFPAMVPLWMYPIALALGNCFVLKPSEKVPCTSQRIGELILEAGLPPGVFSIINGDKACVDALITHPLIRAVAFVGSTPVAKHVYTQATSLGKRALCLGGAKNSLILMPDADESIAVPRIISSFTGCAGQRCMAASLLLAVGNVDALIEKIVTQAKTLQCGSGMGAIIERPALERLKNAIATAERQGARIVLDGRSPRPPKGFEAGNWLAPTIIDHATTAMECATTELFGPVLTIIRTKNLSDALEIDQRSEFGNATSVFTSSGAVARAVAERATSGMIGINIGVPVPREPFSFGGTKHSKFGSGDITGVSSLELWSDSKKITSKWEALNEKNQGAHSWMS